MERTDVLLFADSLMLQFPTTGLQLRRCPRYFQDLFRILHEFGPNSINQPWHWAERP
jgi:hypothetical protein